MRDLSSHTEHSLRIVHVFRAPVGGLFRHVVDLAGEQIRLGHHVGLVVDSETGGEAAARILAALAGGLKLGLTRFPMRRDPHPADALALIRFIRTMARARPDVVHGHGSKGALYARLAAPLRLGFRKPAAVYTPHGGSLHFDPRSLKGRLVLGTERLLSNRADLIIFESTYAAERFAEAVGPTTALTRIVHNGLSPGEFAPVRENGDAAEFLYVGELRLLKGVDVFIEALAALPATAEGRLPHAVIVGAGPDRDRFEQLAGTLGLGNRVRFAGPLPAREAFAMGRVLVVPSRAESLPYIVLEAIGAGRPLLATRVGGIPEILGPFADRLVPPGDAGALRDAMAGSIAQSPANRLDTAASLARHVQTGFSMTRMVEGVMAGYREAIARTRRDGGRRVQTAVLQPHRSGS